MSGTKKLPVKTILLSSVAALALLATPVSIGQIASGGDLIAKAYADEGGKGGKGHKGGGAGQGKGGAQGAGGKGGSSMGKGGSGGSSGSGHVPGAVTTSDDSDDKKGPKYAGGGAGSGGSDGGKPVWAQEGIPEVELGRLNVARAPEHVLKRQLDEALTSFDPAMAAFYNMTLAEYVTALTTDYDSVLRLDSPLMNLSLYKDLIINSATALPGVTNSADALAAIFIGTASDKLVAVTPDTVTALNAILGLPALTDAETAALAANADDVREAISAGHGL